jgi:putative tryptophan/tyrosine transport system substrate-binding protein
MIDRRSIICGAGAAAFLPLTDAFAQQEAMPVIGFLRSTPRAPFVHMETAFREGLKDQGFIEGQNVRIEYRFADNDMGRMPALAAELINRKVAVIIGNSSGAALAAAKGTTPVLFAFGGDPVSAGYVATLARPGGNATGVTFFSNAVTGKRLQFLKEFVPQATSVAVLLDPSYAAAAADRREIESAASALGLTPVFERASTDAELELAFKAFAKAATHALLIAGAPFPASRRERVVALAAELRLPACYDIREYVSAGGLMSYAANQSHSYRILGTYAGRILKGEKPADMPVQQPTKLELVINAGTAKTLGLAIPPTLLAFADEVIE